MYFVESLFGSSKDDVIDKQYTLSKNNSILASMLMESKHMKRPNHSLNKVMGKMGMHLKRKLKADDSGKQQQSTEQLDQNHIVRNSSNLKVNQIALEGISKTAEMLSNPSNEKNY